MNSRLLDDVACPVCRGEGALTIRPGSDVDGMNIRCGFLDCPQCDQAFPVIDGVAILDQEWTRLLQESRPYIEHAVPRDAIPQALRNDFHPDSTADDLAVADDVSPYVINHLCFSGTTFPDNPLDEVQSPRSPRLRAVIRACAEAGPYQLVSKEVTLGTRHLDVGCSVGTAVSLSARQGAGIALGVDISFAAVHVGRKMLGSADRSASGIHELIVASAERLPLQPGKWSFVSALNVIDEIEGPTETMRELERVLAPDGRVLLVAPFREEFPQYASARLELVSRKTDLPWVILRGARYVEYLSVDAYVYRSRSPSPVQALPGMS